MIKSLSIGRRCPALGSPSFTLVEMLAAIAVFSIIIVVLTNMVVNSTDAWQAVQAHSERRNTADTVFGYMSRDLRQLALPSARANINNLQFIINPSGVGTQYEYPQAVFWQAPVATDGGTNGNLAVVGYFVQWVTNGSSSSPCLSRVLLNPSLSGYEIYSNPEAWISSDLLVGNAPATEASSYQGLLANNVLGLWIQALDLNGNPIKQGSLAGESFDSRLPYSYTNALYPSVATTCPPSSLPASIEVVILTVDSLTAKRLTGSEKPGAVTGDFWSDIYTFYNSLLPRIRKGAEIQTTTIAITAGPR